VIYLDANATTRPAEGVLSALVDGSTRLMGNPSSAHLLGREAARAIDLARESISLRLGSDDHRVVFTSGATESNNLAIHGLWANTRSMVTPRNTVLVGATEHPSVMEPIKALEKQGAIVKTVPVDSTGQVQPEVLKKLLNDQVLLVAVMVANSETGVISPVRALAKASHEVGAWFLTDATQAVGKIPVSAAEFDVDLMSISAHKFYGPKGVGALLLRRSLRLGPQMLGGGQQQGQRSGTFNTAGIVGMAAACDLIPGLLEGASEVKRLRDYFWSSLERNISGLVLNGSGAPRLPNTANIHFPGCDAEALMAGMPDVACSAGTACHAGAPEPSQVLLAMGLSREAAGESLRFSLCADTTQEDVEIAVRRVVDAVKYLQEISDRGERIRG